MLLSAKTGQRTEKLLKSVLAAKDQFRRWISTSIINDIINDALLYQAPSKVGLKSGNIHYVVQASTCPPTFVLFCNDAKLFTDTYKNFLERKIRESLGFEGTPLKLIFRSKPLRKSEQDKKKIDKLLLKQ